MKLRFFHRDYYSILKIKDRLALNQTILALRDCGVLGLQDCIVSRNSVFAGCNSVGPSCTIKSTDVGFGTYIGSDCYFEKTSVGKYCSIANNVRVTAGSHPSSEWVSTHPAFYSKAMWDQFGYVNEQLYYEFKYADKDNKKYVCIGNDVWIGAEVTILEGVTIGNGAIIAAKAMVTKDVAPYEIVGGVPAKHIKWRFGDEDREFLQKLRWWDKTEKWLKENAPLFCDIRKLREKYDK